jgi:hypothetical protein
VRIAKSSKEQDGYEAPDTTGARLNPEAPERHPGSHLQGGAKRISKTDFCFKGERKKFKAGRIRTVAIWQRRSFWQRHKSVDREVLDEPNGITRGSK